MFIHINAPSDKQDARGIGELDMVPDVATRILPTIPNYEASLNSEV